MGVPKENLLEIEWTWDSEIDEEENQIEPVKAEIGKQVESNNSWNRPTKVSSPRRGRSMITGLAWRECGGCPRRPTSEPTSWRRRRAGRGPTSPLSPTCRRCRKWCGGAGRWRTYKGTLRRRRPPAGIGSAVSPRREASGSTPRG